MTTAATPPLFPLALDAALSSLSGATGVGSVDSVGLSASVVSLVLSVTGASSLFYIMTKCFIKSENLEVWN